MTPDPLRGDWLRRKLASARVRIFARLGSTNATARRLLESGEVAAPAVIIAARQTAGRGQRANQWWSDAGSVCATFLLPSSPTLPIGQIPLRAGLAVATVVAHHLPRGTVRVKWPNDVLANGRKLAGLLCARLRGADVIGIGLNVRTDLAQAPADVRARATSIRQESGRVPRRDEVIVELWAALADALNAEDWSGRYAALHALHGRRVRLDCDGVIRSGRCQGVDEEGRLRFVESDGTLHALTEGAVLDWSG